MTAFHTFLGVLCALGVVGLSIIVACAIYDKGYVEGFSRGYDEGRREEAGWWVNVSAEVQEIYGRKIGREEPDR